ncbi:aldo/keto reductase [Coccomyxa subellipsoidea C-169]|uniref:Aldo/keto reductase n=1 Tax=Coccomyxa subellipsoidea (strain C-169) TaxID=574566 RepID=I0ZAH2_COCSC|nr:aldo/keto reductase [Coccomyxa subellipsoidea C-169]EIE27641.1 aldo/keto reductase [Coccomyxa subellipsoidea C-169]|eukprot:XP_005652185.1 aldo/keto reductase [Coccomyxa subellipsoidea C-169]
MTSAKVPVRPLGSHGMLSSAQGLGCMGMSWGYTNADRASGSEPESIAVIHRAQELGITHLDTSDVYGPHTNEQLVGQAIAGRRDQYTIATKFGAVFSEKGAEVHGSPEYVRSAVEGSLKRLGIDQIDLYYQHRVDRTVPIEETWKALKELVEEGKVKYLGISEATADEIRRAHAVHPITACQLEWSLWTRGVEDEIIPTLRELGIGIVAYSPLGRGFLTGAITKIEDLGEGDTRSKIPRFQKGAFESNFALVERVKELAAKKGVTAGQLALAWVHAQGPDVFPIPGTKRIKYLEENAAAFHIQLNSDEKAYLEEIFNPEKVVGSRYHPANLAMGYEGGKDSS